MPSVHALGNAYTKNINLFGVTPQKQSLIHFKNGFTQVYRPKKEFEETIQSLANLIITNPKKVEDLLCEHEAINKKVEEFALLNIPSSAKESQKWVTCLESTLNEFYSYYIFNVFLLLALEKTNKEVKWVKQAEVLRNKNHYFTIENLLEEFAKSKGFSKNEVCHLSVPQLKKLSTKKSLLGGENEEMVYFVGGKQIKLSEEETKIISASLNNKFSEKQSSKKSSFVSGLTASLGTTTLGAVSGKGKVVLSRKDYQKVSKGDIVIATMTTPEIAPLLSCVSGIITDEGSLTCHAAILAREMKIPCLVGTKNATQVFCDGDKILLDAKNKKATKI